jgi:hypothetical protein
MKRSDRKYFLVFLVFISLLSPACNHSKQDAASNGNPIMVIAKQGSHLLLHLKR